MPGPLPASAPPKRSLSCEGARAPSVKPDYLRSITHQRRPEPAAGPLKGSDGFPVDWPALIRHLREVRGLKQEALAALLGVSQSAVSRWERNIGRPSLAAARQLRALTAAQPGRHLDLLKAEARASFYPMAISTADGLQVVYWNALLKQRLGLAPRRGEPAYQVMQSSWFEHYRESGIGAREMNILVSYDETRVGNSWRFARILAMPCLMREFVILRIQPISRQAYINAPFRRRITTLAGNIDA
jgi:transcriptional regulator with XRE-family HTH domain